MNEQSIIPAGPVRRVVTGHDANNRSVFLRDEQVEPITPALLAGAAIHWLYGADELPDLPVSEPLPTPTMFYPPPGGCSFGLLTVPPDHEMPETGFDVGEALAELERDLPGMASYVDPSHPGMHRTATIDAVIVLGGSLTLELDDGAKVELSPGDTVIQNGTRHRWTNSGSTPATMAYFLYAVQKDALGPEQ